MKYSKNTEFNLELAKRGCVCFCPASGALFIVFGGYTENEEGVNTYDNHWIDCVCISSSTDGADVEYAKGWVGFMSRRLWGMRMATPDECEAAGVAYIEPPVSAEELVELRKDKEWLDFMSSTVSSVYFSSSHGGMYLVMLNDIILGTGKTPREAIDAAMKGWAQ